MAAQLGHARLIEALDQDLDGAALRVRRRLKCLDGLLEREAVRDELGQVNDAAPQQADGAWPGVAVAVLQLDVDLADRGAHKRNGDVVLADADDEDLAAKLGRPDGRRDAALDARALHGQRGLDAAHGLDNLPTRRLRPDPRRHVMRDDARAHLPRKRQPARGNVRDDERARAGGGAAQQRDEADGPRAADEHGVAEARRGALNGREGHAERLQQRALVVRQAVELVAPHGRVVDVAPQQAVDGRRRQEGDARAAVVPPRQARLAGVAHDIGLDGDAVPDGERRH